MDWKNQLTRTPYLVLFIFLAAIGVGTASALITITLAGDVIIEGNTQMDNNLNVDGAITGNTINDLKQDILDIQKSIFFMDIVVANTGDDDISVGLGNGNGTFARNDVNILSPRGISIGNINNDGFQDVVVLEPGNNLMWVMFGSSDGGVGLESGFDVGNDARATAIGDLDNDGDPDVVVTNGEDGNISVLRGNGDDGFVGSNVDVGNDPRGIAIGDLNNDGDQDVVVANEFVDGEEFAKIAVLLGNGNGTFDRTDVIVGEFLNAVAIGDLNNDGDQDVVVTNQIDNNIFVLLGEGDGNFTSNPVSVGNNPQRLAIGDLDNDGKLDIVVSNQGDNNISVLGGLGDGTFFRDDWGVGDSPQGVAIGDLDNDGVEDIVVASKDFDLIFVLLGEGDLLFDDAITPFDVGVEPADIAIGNIGGKPLT